jgi:ubiquitin-conjugating enzyme (huntingtin interacting protein 2)
VFLASGQALWRQLVASTRACVNVSLLQTALVSLQALLSAPEPDSPQDAEVASQYKSDNAAWAAKARYWTETHAMGGGSASDPKVDQLMAMGFERAAVTRALLAKGGNVEEAMELLLSS